MKYSLVNLSVTEGNFLNYSTDIKSVIPFNLRFYKTQLREEPLQREFDKEGSE